MSAEPVDEDGPVEVVLVHPAAGRTEFGAAFRIKGERGHRLAVATRPVDRDEREAARVAQHVVGQVTACSARASGGLSTTGTPC